MLDRGRSNLNSLYALEGRCIVVVASTGGHLEQALRWSDRLQLRPDSIFITFDNEQSRHLLKRRPHAFIPYVAPRDLRGAIQASIRLGGILDRRKHDAVLSTGAGVALAALPPAVLRGLPLFYIESVSRFEGPSLTGRLLSRIPRSRMYAQHESYKSSRWTVVPNLLTNYVPVAPSAGGGRPRRFFVTLGTIRPFRFDSLVDAVLGSLEQDDEIVWQLGDTSRTGLPGVVHRTVSPDKFDRYAQEADVVVTHAGVGSILRLLDLGISPIVVPRRKGRKEHVDDHQVQVARELSRHGTITHLGATEMTNDALHQFRPTVRLVEA